MGVGSTIARLGKGDHSMRQLVCICLAVLTGLGMIGCASQTPTLVAQQALMVSTATPYPTYTPYSTYTSAPVSGQAYTPYVTDTSTRPATAVPTNTPLPTPTDTATATATSRPTTTPTRPPTATPPPGVGDTVRCDDMWEVTVATSPSFAKTLNVLDTAGYMTFASTEQAKGTWMLVFFQLVNLQSQTDGLSSFGDELYVQAKLEGRIVSFSPSSWGTSRAQRVSGISDWNDDVPPGVSITAMAIFDVNPEASEWMLTIEPEDGWEKVCRSDILLDYSMPEVLEGAPVVVMAQAVNLREGPGTAYPVAGKGGAGQRFEIVGRNMDSSWWSICCVERKRAWVADSVIETMGDLSEVPLVEDIPTPPPTSLPPATATPFPRTSTMGQEFQVGTWGLKLYDVKKTKAVYWFGIGEAATGIWLIPFVEVHNLGNGTADAHRDLDLYSALCRRGYLGEVNAVVTNLPLTSAQSE